jgi:hypothetical protein
MLTLVIAFAQALLQSQASKTFGDTLRRRFQLVGIAGKINDQVDK